MLLIVVIALTVAILKLSNKVVYYEGGENS
jgi:hypothetical protein